MQVDRPIFIMGPHRSGTTLLYNILAAHPDVGYFNRANRRFVRFPGFARLLTRLGVSNDAPLEAQNIWDRFWCNEDDVMGAADAPNEVADWYRLYVARVLQLRGAKRFLAKYPRLSLRVDWIEKIFPDAIYVHLIRDWRAVVNSTVARKVKRDEREGGWFGVRIPGWKGMGDLPHPIAAGRQYRAATQALEKSREPLAGRFLSVSYEALCDQPLETMRSIAAHCGFEWTPELEQAIPSTLRSANYKWREQLDPSDVKAIRAEDDEFFRRHEATESNLSQSTSASPTES